MAKWKINTKSMSGKVFVGGSCSEPGVVGAGTKLMEKRVRETAVRAA
ncbi:hypothetical protein [Paenibacillus koleovorans]|nr:hypothetical protein [Paenibacillus koleovorans]